MKTIISGSGARDDVRSVQPGRRSDQWNARREGGSRTLLSSQIVKRYEAALERLNDRLRPILDAKLSQQVGDVGLHGFVADIEVAAISRFECPSASSRRTSRSRV